jgi:hypothetical protein
MNSNLYDKTFPVPDNVIKYLEQCFNSANGDSTIEGYKRNQELRNTKEVTYQQLKRMKNWFDGFNGHENDKPFILNGGHYVKQWVNDLLTSKRDEDKMGKEIKSVVLPNQFNDAHKKDNIEDMNRPSKSHSSTVNRMNEEVTENLKRINELIKKII